MMPFDSTGNMIVICVAASALYAVIELIKFKEIQVTNCVLVFLAVYASTAGYDLIVVAIEGNPENLPSSWRESIVVAGVVSIGLPVQYLIKSIKKLFAKSIQAEEI